MYPASSLRARITVAALALAASAFLIPSAHADGAGYPADANQHISINGAVRHVDAATNCVSIASDDNRNYTVDADNASIILANISRNAGVADLNPGMHVRASGTLVSRSVIEAETVREVSAVAIRPTALDRADTGGSHLDGVIRLVDPDNGRITVADGAGRQIVVDVFDSAIALGRSQGAGHIADLTRGMHVRIDGTRLAHGRMIAETVREVPAVRDADMEITTPSASAPAVQPMPVEVAPLPFPSAPTAGSLIPPSPDPQYVLAHLDSYTGILIDARHLPNILRSPSPAIYGPEPGESLLYPNRSDVPTPDEVQDESIVRYYHTVADATNGVDGAHPLILPAQTVLGPAKDSLQLSADDMTLFNALERKLHFTHTWKVGFLIPGNE